VTKDKKNKPIKIHKKWTINPRTRIKQSAKDYNRLKNNEDWKKELKDGEYDI
jgi:hypothetical protein